MMATCHGHGCEVELDQNHRGRPRKWCSARCRKLTLYARPCLDCGTPCNTDGRVTNAAERCDPCSRKHQVKQMTAYILDSMHEWHKLFGVPPTSMDWNQHNARNKMATAPTYAQRIIDRFESTGRPWPYTSEVQRIFGTWNKGLIAAGYEPMKPGDRWLGRHGEKCMREEQAA